MDKLLSWPEVEEIVGLSRVTVWRREKDGEFPARRQIGPNRVGWLRSEISEWMQNLPTGAGRTPGEGS